MNNAPWQNLYLIKSSRLIINHTMSHKISSVNQTHREQPQEPEQDPSRGSGSKGPPIWPTWTDRGPGFTALFSALLNNEEPGDFTELQQKQLFKKCRSFPSLINEPSHGWVLPIMHLPPRCGAILIPHGAQRSSWPSGIPALPEKTVNNTSYGIWAARFSQRGVKIKIYVMQQAIT